VRRVRGSGRRRPRVVVLGGLAALASLAAVVAGCGGGGGRLPHERWPAGDVTLTIASASVEPGAGSGALRLGLELRNDSGGDLWVPRANRVVVADATTPGGVLVVDRVLGQAELDAISWVQDPGPSSADRLGPGATELVRAPGIPLAGRSDDPGRWSRGAPDPVRAVRYCLAVVPASVVADAGYDVSGETLDYPWDDGWWASRVRLVCSDAIELAEPVALDWATGSG